MVVAVKAILAAAVTDPTEAVVGVMITSRVAAEAAGRSIAGDFPNPACIFLETSDEQKNRQLCRNF